MRRGSLVLLFLLAACPGGGGGIGDHCTGHGDCASNLQCLASTCVARCERAPDCGDGYSCDDSGLCHAAVGQAGDACTSEVQCAAGLACELDGTDLDADGHLLASCVLENSGRPVGDVCAADGDCRNGTCALGHCVDLCADSRDCAAGLACVHIPRIEAWGTDGTSAMFSGCLQAHGALRWTIPIHGPADFAYLPIPDSASSVAVSMFVEDPNQKVGVTDLVSPDPTQPPLFSLDNDYYINAVRHAPGFAQSVLAMPSSPATPLVPGAYSMRISSLRTPFIRQAVGTATPTVTAVVKLDTSVILDLHFYFLNFDDHPCADKFNGQIDAQVASTASFFQSDFLGMMRTIFAHGGVALGTMTYEDLRDHPELDGLDINNVGQLLSLGAHDVGINVFFVRTLSPVGLQAFGPSPGPAGLAGTLQSGIVVGLDTLCYRSWSELAKLTAHELARYMGLYNNVEIDYDATMSPFTTHVDPIDDSDTVSDNLMFYSELNGTDLSAGQRDILSRSGVLR